MSKVLVNESSLFAIGEAIRNKKSTNEHFKPSEMAAAINTIETGGGSELPANAPTIFSGNLSYTFTNTWSWYINAYKDKIATVDITNLNYAFRNNTTFTDIPFDLNCRAGTALNLLNIFNGCNNLQSIPKINNCRPYGTSSMFDGCQKIRYLPDNFSDSFDWSYADSSSGYSNANIFRYCYSLRDWENMRKIMQHGKPASTNSSSIYYNALYCCYALDEATGLPLPHTQATWTSNAFNGSFYAASRINNMTFATDNGTPYKVNWKSQTIDLSSFVGYCANPNYITNYNSGITLDKRVTDDTTYQALKNNPDWFTSDISYSRYNHDSAVATINSLPDTSAYLASAGGSNTIKFKKESGRNTDGGAVGDLTAEEIAVAAAKGWTVTLAN